MWRWFHATVPTCRHSESPCGWYGIQGNQPNEPDDKERPVGIAVYDRESGSFCSSYRAVTSPLSEELGRFLGKGLRVLDVGCGSGRDLAWLVEHGHEARGIEPSKDMRVEAWEKIGNALTQADLFIAIGTSGVVYPAAGFAALAGRHGIRTIEVNPVSTEISPHFDEHLRGPATAMVPAWVDEILSAAG